MSIDELQARYDRVVKYVKKMRHFQQKNDQYPNAQDRTEKKKYERLVDSLLTEDKIAMASVQQKLV